jgi:hypothetical protein
MAHQPAENNQRLLDPAEHKRKQRGSDLAPWWVRIRLGIFWLAKRLAAEYKRGWLVTSAHPPPFINPNALRLCSHSSKDGTFPASESPGLSLGPRMATAPAAKRWRAPIMQEANLSPPGLRKRSSDPTLGRKRAVPPTWGSSSGVRRGTTRTRPKQGNKNIYHTRALRPQCRRNTPARRHRETLVATAAPNHLPPSEDYIRRRNIPPSGEVWHGIPRSL